MTSAGLARTARGAPFTPSRRFLFIYNFGGSDPFCALSPSFGRTHIAMPPASQPARSGNIDWVDMGVGQVRTYFDSWYEKSHIINALSIPSVSHEVCTELLYTGLIGAGRPDWPSQLTASRSDLDAPAFVLGGPSFPGELATRVVRTGQSGQLAHLLDGTLLSTSDVPNAVRLDPAWQDAARAYESARASARADAVAGRPGGAITGAWNDVARRATSVRAALRDVSLFTNGSLRSQVDVAIDLFKKDIASVVSASSQTNNVWDTHEDNDAWQNTLNAELFGVLDYALGTLATTPAPSGGSLLDEVVVVVLTEMGRTPMYNTKEGRDHWPYASILLAGAGVRGNSVTGAFDDAGFGEEIDFDTGAPTPGGVVASAEHLGATLLSLGGVDWTEVVPFSRPIGWVMA